MPPPPSRARLPVAANEVDVSIAVDSDHPPAIAVLGMGNILLTDDGVGVHALRALEQGGQCPPEVRFVDGGTLSFSLAEIIETADALLLLDATEFDAPPGTLRVFEGAALDAFLGRGRKRSVHEVALSDLMALAALAGHLPRRRALIGIQPASFAWGEAPSAAVADVIPAVCERSLALISDWQSQWQQ